MTALANKRYWLVGASEGIGRELAIQLAQQGVKLIISARQADRLASLLAELPGSGHQAVAVDVADTPSVLAAAQQIGADSPLDGLIFNAGVYQPMDAADFDLASAEATINVNTTGALRVLSAAVGRFVSQKSGHIVLVASVAGYRGLPSALPYGASKAALIHIAENLVCDLAQHNIKVQVVNPGFVATRLTAKNDFKMPGIISPQRAAAYIVKGMQGGRFEIAFPPLFVLVMKALAALPRWLYFKIVA